ncbi:unnamed protein product [Rotaria sp. Silwood2]|nr:unnamed protein product [Rotaria sp. Silwood2]CAF4421952.1 unnamed protein product [Rotaria sp. Silwood2]CAF4605068.1 unnamed protein product [Rotaria sp. Silwood2]
MLLYRARNFPALINNTTIDYFARWPQQVLYAVAEHFLSRFKLISDEYKNNIIEHMAMIHESANFYSERLNAGIIRIDEASVLIQEMDKKLEIQRKELG